MNRPIPMSLLITGGVVLLFALFQSGLALKRQNAHIRWHRRQDQLRFDLELEDFLDHVNEDEF